jgi:uncharacterized protein YndB with AHSA1/START domain
VRRLAAPKPCTQLEAELIQKWLLGPDGWTMPVCVNEARPGGKIRYEWADARARAFILPASS